MVSSSGKNILCFFHVGGNFLQGGEDESDYVGGMVRTRCIKERTTHEELQRTISSLIGKESDQICVRFKVSMDTSTFIDLVEHEGVDHLIRYNNEYGHVYVEEIRNNDNRLARAKEEEVSYDVYGGSTGLSISPREIFNETQEFPSLPCSSQIVPLTRPEMNHGKWKDLIMGAGQIIANVVTLLEMLYKYSIAHNFVYKFVKNKPQKIIVKCKVDGCPWYLGAYSAGGEHQETEFLIIRTYRGEHIHHAQDSLIVSHPPKCTLTSSIVLDGLRCNIEKTPHEIRTDLQEFKPKLMIVVS